MIKKILNWLIVALAAVSVVLFVAIATQRWRVHDDWLFVVRLNKMGLFNWAWEYYKTWDARFLFPAFLSYWTFIKFFGFKATMVFCSLVHLTLSYFVLKVIEQKAKVKIKWTYRIILAIIINFAFWYCIRQIMVDTLYWMTAGIYIWVLLLNFMWLYWLLSKNYATKKPSILFYLFTFIIASSAQNISVGALFILFIMVLKNMQGEGKNWKKYKPQLWLIAIGVIGLGVSTISIGSMKQFGDEMVSNYGTGDQAGFKALVVHWFALYKDAFSFFGLIIYVFPVIIGLLILSTWENAGFRLNLKPGSFAKISFKKMVDHMHKNMFFYAAFWSLLIYWPTPLLAPRYYIGFYFYLFVHIILLVIRSYEKLEQAEHKKNWPMAQIGAVLILVMSISVYKNAYSNSKLMKEFRHQRDLVLQENKGTSKKVYVPNFRDDFAPIIVKQEELSPDSSYIYNLILQDYFKIKRLEVSKQLKWYDLLENKDNIKGLVRQHSRLEK